MLKLTKKLIVLKKIWKKAADSVASREILIIKR